METIKIQLKFKCGDIVYNRLNEKMTIIRIGFDGYVKNGVVTSSVNYLCKCEGGAEQWYSDSNLSSSKWKSSY